jgi:hypothetical protein
MQIELEGNLLDQNLNELETIYNIDETSPNLNNTLPTKAPDLKKKWLGVYW